MSVSNALCLSSSLFSNALTFLHHIGRGNNHCLFLAGGSSGDIGTCIRGLKQLKVRTATRSFFASAVTAYICLGGRCRNGGVCTTNATDFHRRLTSTKFPVASGLRSSVSYLLVNGSGRLAFRGLRSTYVLLKQNIACLTAGPS